jgi:glycosidase
MPIHPIGEKQRKGRLGSPYSVRDYYGINPDFGTPDDFRRLVKEVHRRGMHIILDMVPNHTAWDNPLIVEHPGWYTQDNEGKIISPNADWTDVADLNYDRPEVRTYIQDVLVWWIREYGVDGFRIDVAELTPGDFWAETRYILERARADLPGSTGQTGVFLLAEGNRPYLHVSGFNVTYAFNTFLHLIQIANGQLPPSVIHEDLDKEAHGYPQGSLRMRFLENHDQLRAAKVIPNPAALEAATACAFLLPGIPMLYNGAEVALDHRLELFDVDPIDWSRGSEVFRQRVKEILALGQRYAAAVNGTYEPLKVTSERSLAFARSMGDQQLIAVFNFSDEEIQILADERDKPFEETAVVIDRGLASLGAVEPILALAPWGYVVFIE